MKSGNATHNNNVIATHNLPQHATYVHVVVAGEQTVKLHGHLCVCVCFFLILCAFLKKYKCRCLLFVDISIILPSCDTWEYFLRVC